MIPAPESWAAVDRPKRQRREMDVVVVLPGEEQVAYRRAFKATMDAYGQALDTYPCAVRITVTPVPREAAHAG